MPGCFSPLLFLFVCWQFCQRFAWNVSHCPFSPLSVYWVFAKPWCVCVSDFVCVFVCVWICVGPNVCVSVWVCLCVSDCVWVRVHQCKWLVWALPASVFVPWVVSQLKVNRASLSTQTEWRVHLSATFEPDTSSLSVLQMSLPAECVLVTLITLE